MKQKLKVKFGDLESGWFPITITHANTIVEIDASDIPSNPIFELIAVLERCFMEI